MRKILRTITTKYMIIFMSLIVLTVFVLGMMIATILADYAIDVQKEELSTSNILFQEYYKDMKLESGLAQGLRDDENGLKETLSVAFLVSEGCHLVVADETGEIVMYARKNTKDSGVAVDFILENGNNYDIFKKSALSLEIAESIRKDGNASMNSNCDSLFNDKVIWCASSLKGEDGSLGGYVISFTPFGDEDRLFEEMLYSISLTAMWLLFAALVAIYVVSYKVMTPLREISNAAKSFARGNFDVRVPERGNDEMAELARSFNKMAVEIKSKDDMQKQFLSSASHDLRTPMTTIAGFVDGILDGAIPKEKQEYYLNIIKNEVKRLSRLVSSLLDISRLQSGDRKFSKKPFNICELARQTIISFEQQFNEKNLDVEFEADEFDMFAIGDEDAINQVVYNLCHNAIKFSYDKGHYRVKISYTDEGEIKFSLYNEGIGIVEEELPFVFDRFYKSDKSRGLDKTGVGLGLFISKTIIDAHNGDMAVNSEYEKWCEFYFTLERGDKGW